LELVTDQHRESKVLESRKKAAASRGFKFTAGVDTRPDGGTSRPRMRQMIIRACGCCAGTNPRETSLMSLGDAHPPPLREEGECSA
jgi:hypothetical protein